MVEQQPGFGLWMCRDKGEERLGRVDVEMGWPACGPAGPASRRVSQPGSLGRETSRKAKCAPTSHERPFAIGRLPGTSQPAVLAGRGSTGRLKERRRRWTPPALGPGRCRRRAAWPPTLVHSCDDDTAPPHDPERSLPLIPFARSLQLGAQSSSENASRQHLQSVPSAWPCPPRSLRAVGSGPPSDEPVAGRSCARPRLPHEWGAASHR
jgi:hypothetical protein